ncbi:MAG: thiol peroxidase [Planctomycetes bacterium]|nr:thiol peroxidase [Planctomycetota bacterium]MBL7107676.1 thiol peroxidase [Phycisphaerae bacterium]
MEKENKYVTLEGKRFSLIGNLPEIGSKLPDFKLLKNDLTPFSLSDISQKVCIITAVPSLDTSVCDKMTRNFNQQAANLDENILVLAVSMDLPFAQKRWCAAAGIENVITLSDHLNANFGKALGILIEELRLLARTVFIIDKNSIVRYVQLVEEISDQPDYEAAVDAAKKILSD